MLLYDQTLIRLTKFHGYICTIFKIAKNLQTN